MPDQNALQPVELFFSYSHKDEKLRDKLAVHLSMLERQGVIKSWHDRKIAAGTEWAAAIDDNLNSAGVILLLISPDFLASNYCYDIEMKQAVARHEAGEARVIPIILKPVDWSGAPFGKLQAFPKNAKPVTTWANRDEAFLNIAQGIRQAAEEMAKVLAEKPSTTPDTPTPSTPPSQPTTVTNSESVSLPPLELDDRAGQVPLNSPFYIERPPMETECYQAIAQPGALLLIKAPRQMGKTSLTSRVLNHAEKQLGYRKAYLLFQEADDDEFFKDLNIFLQWFCATVTFELGLEDKVEDYWKGGMLGPKQKCTNYFQRYLLPQVGTALILGLDDVDVLFEHFDIAEGFFELLRAWHERSKNEETWQRLHLVMNHSQEVYISLNVNKSPFNVGKSIRLLPFNQAQVADLAQKHRLNWSEAQVAQLMEMVDGHPYLLRVALYQIASGNMTLEKFLEKAPTEEGPYANHLRNHLAKLEQDTKLGTAMRQVVFSEQPVQLDSAQQFKLCSMGLTEWHGNAIAPLCNLYRIYFRDRLN